MKTNRVVIVQCRLSSSRLPEKAVKKLGDKFVLAWVLASMHKVPADLYFVATDEASFPVIKDICTENDFECFAGSLNDVLKRFCDLLKTLKCETVIRATADNPFLFYEAAEESVIEFEKRNSGKDHCDYFTYSGLPHGSGVEIFSSKALLKAAEETDSPYDHEHVGPALYNHKDKYICEFVPAPARYNFPQLRTTIDTYSDYLRAINVVNYLKKDGPYTTEEILEAVTSKKVIKPVVLCPSVTKGHGTGHLHRCLCLSISKDYFVYIPEESNLEETKTLISQYVEQGLKSQNIITQLPDESYKPVIITDSFKITQPQLQLYNNASSIISLDEGSEYTDYADYLLDIIPSAGITRKSNCTDSNFIKKPENKKSSVPQKINKVLICFGGEDPANFSEPAASEINRLLPDAEITVIYSKQSNFSSSGNIKYIPPVKNLREQLYNYDLVITHYGLTAFEAASAGCGVILFPTTKLHVKLAKKNNFACVTDVKKLNSQLNKNLNDKNLFKKIENDSQNLGDFLEDCAKNGKKYQCPVCGLHQTVPDTIISRNNTRTYRRCQNCSMIYISFSTEPEKEYKKQYFFEDYKKQYGKTYQEDFESIKNQCKKRIVTIKQVAKFIKNKSVLDIGCAYGPFLSAAKDEEMKTFGTDISDDAVNFVQEKLGIPAIVSAFPKLNVTDDFGVSDFDVVTMWYVIEHFKNLDSVLRKVNSLLKKGGVFAFSTPSGEGISPSADLHHFYEISPTDHYTVWEPSKAGKILEKYGFKISRIVSTGHHPERFPFVKKYNIKKGSFLWKCVYKYSQIFKKGDTVEIYCKKIKVSK